MVRAKLSVDLSGPFFQKDPELTVRQNIRKMLMGVALEGERLVQSNFPVYTGAGRQGVRGRVSSLSGKRWALTAVVSQTHVYPWPKGGQKQYRGGKLEAKYHMFRKAASAVRRVRADLTEGLN